MKDKFFHFTEQYHKILHIANLVLTWGGALLILIVSIATGGFPGGLILGLFWGSIFALVVGLSTRHAERRAVEAGQELRAYASGRADAFNVSKQKGAAVLGIMAMSFITVALLISCRFYPCTDDLFRPRLIGIGIILNLIIEKLFYQERITGKPAIITLSILLLGVCALIVWLFLA